MKTLYSLLLVCFLNVANLLSQVQFTDHYNFTAECIETSYNYSTQTIVYTHNDSVIVDMLMTEQCCAKFSLKINSEPNDTIFLQLTDTAEAQCDCMCRFKIRINAGEKNAETHTVNLNGGNYLILDEDYKPLVQSNKSWNVMNLIPGLEYSFPNLLKYTIENNEPHFFCWNGISYLKVNVNVITSSDSYSFDTIPKYIREANGKVYQLDSTDQAFDGCNEFLLYDFTAKPGDIVYLGYDSIPFEVNEKGIDEQTGRRYWILSDISQPYTSVSESSNLPISVTKWIEGIGDLRGVFESKRSLFIDGSYYKLACCHIKDSLLYQDPDYPECGERPPYNFFIENGKKWTSVNTCIFYPDTSYEVNHVTVDASNIVDNPYAMRFYPDSANKDIYFQEENGKVYYNDYDDRYLIYDFTLNTGDSVLVGNDAYEYLYVDSVTYLKYEDDALRKTLYLSGIPGMNGATTRTWVEGIGDLYSPLTYWMPLLTYGDCDTEFACCNLFENLIYHNPKYPDCGLHLSIDDIRQQSIRFYPNPTNGLINLEYPSTYNNAEYAVYSVSGKLLQKGSLKNTLQFNVPDGIFILTISLEQKTIFRDILMINTKF